MTNNNDTGMKRLGYRAPADVAGPDQLVLIEYASGGRVALITLNWPHAFQHSAHPDPADPQMVGKLSLA